jgi:coatomer subunit beta'
MHRLNKKNHHSQIKILLVKFYALWLKSPLTNLFYDFHPILLKYRLIKIWDYLSKSCIQTLEGHQSNVSYAIFHPSLPIIISGSEDGTVKIWHSSTYRLENTLNYGLERAWCVTYGKKGNDIGLGFDEGSVVVKLGREEPTISMDVGGKIVFTRNAEVLTCNVAAAQGNLCT